MGLIAQASQVGKAVKNVGRLREMITAMTRFGFGSLVEKIGLRQFSNISKAEHGDDTVIDADVKTFAVRLRLLLEQLGPSTIKIGQILAGRPDICPPEIVEELSKLQDKVHPLPFALLKPLLEKDLGRPIAECFESINETPLASASIAQVHSARTHSGENVVVKIKKPDVEKLLTQDLEILELVISLIERYLPELAFFRLSDMIKQFKRSLLAECNFILEANNTVKYKENFSKQNFLVIPKVYLDLSGPHVITQEFLRGVKLSQIEEVRQMGLNPKELLKKGMDCFFQSIMLDGFFHADPHAGNILILNDGRMGLIDFGSVTRLSQKSKDSIVTMFLSLLSEDYDSLIMEYVELSPDSMLAHNTSLIEKLQKEIAETMSPYFGLQIKDIPMGKILMESTRIAFKHHVALPNDLVMVFKAIMTLEGNGQALDPEFNLIESGTRFAKLVLKERYSPKRLSSEALVFGKDYLRLAKTGPRRIYTLLKQFESGHFKIKLDVQGWEQQLRNEQSHAKTLALTILSVGSLVCAALVSQNTSILPFWSIVTVWVTSSCLATYTFWKIFRS